MLDFSCFNTSQKYCIHIISVQCVFSLVCTFQPFEFEVFLCDSVMYNDQANLFLYEGICKEGWISNPKRIIANHNHHLNIYKLKYV
jgi:hypothetical protein